MIAPRFSNSPLRSPKGRTTSAVGLPDHTYAEPGTYHPTLTVTDSGSASSSVSFAVTVGSPQVSGLAGPAGGVSATEGQACDGLATFTGNASDTYTASITWGGAQTNVAAVTGSAGSFTVDDPTGPRMAGCVAVRIVVTDATTGETDPLTLTANVADGGLSAPAPQTLAPIGARTPFCTNGVLIATFSDYGLSTNAADFTATLADSANDDLSATVTWDSASTCFGAQKKGQKPFLEMQR